MRDWKPLPNGRPPKVSELVDETGRHTRVDFRGTQDWSARPDAIFCDFCMSPAARLWCWTVRPFCTMIGRAGLQYDGGQWRACDSCRPLVEARDWTALAARVQITWRIPAESGASQVPASQVPAPVLVCFWRAMCMALADPAAAATVWQAGDPFPGADASAPS